MDAVLDDLGITPLTKDEIKGLFARIGYRRREDARGLMPGVIYKIDEVPVDVSISHPVDMTSMMIELDRRGSAYDAAVYDGGWVSYHSNLGVENGVMLRGPIVITYDNKYR